MDAIVAPAAEYFALRYVVMCYVVMLAAGNSRIQATMVGMPNKHFMRVREVANDSVSVDRVACRFHPDQALVVKEQKRPKGEWPEERKIVVHCPICMQAAHTHEERERSSMTLATELHPGDGPDRAFRVAS